MKDITIPYASFRRFIRRLDQLDALKCIWGYHLCIVDDRPLPEELAADSKDTASLRSHLWPWKLDILSREVILHGRNRNHPLRRLSALSDIQTAINAIHKIGGPDADLDIDVMLYMHRIAHQQFPWQSGGWNRASVIRAWKIYGGDMLDGMVQSKYGMTMQQVIWLGFATGGNFLSRWGMTTRSDYRAPLAIPFEASSAFFETLARTPEQLRELARSHHTADDSWAFTWNPLRLFPLVRYDPLHPEYVMCPVPRFAQERITTGVFYDIVKENGFSDAFGPAFQKYIGDVIKSACTGAFSVIPETEYYVGRHRKDGVDWTLSDATGTLYIECKTKRMRLGAKDMSNPAQLEGDLLELAKAIVQHYKNIDDVLTARSQLPVPKTPVFMMVVTLESWHLMSATVRRQLREMIIDRLKKAGLSSRMVDDIPWQVFAAQEFEQMVQVLNEEGIASLLGEKVTERYRDWDFNGFVQQTRSGWAARYVSLFPDDEARLFPDSVLTRTQLQNH